MRIIFSFLALAFLFTSCDDGDVISVSLEFDDTFDTCGDLVCYKIKSDPSESLSLRLNTTIEALIDTDPDPDNPLLVELANDEIEFTITSTYSFNYRTYSTEITENIFCSDIPPSDVTIVNDYVSNDGLAIFNVVLTEDDNDGIPADLEDENTDGDNNPATNPTDTDNDGIPDYLDADDDGDNVLTSIEIEGQIITSEIELAAVRDTDGDGIANYLDNNDDGDSVLTIDEEGFITPNLNPADDITDPNVGPDYLNEFVFENDAQTTTYRSNTISQTFVLELSVYNVTLPILTQEFVDFGTLTQTSSRVVTPTF
ncbi:hypothetical protein CLV86_0389 [Lacinutrix venerupis]|uniref:Uncharacterized protein n=1 Tax=Lacinutrix venerupis TaxID=1486034 RepID=A0AAC9LMM9_9FLAO|nr:hypothetical protein [Lacinutrix venerupis]APY00185.1 hypothetical protein BWR22_07610 [Lacinutrix venerupis]RLJ68997.1 hypothetical protein CLV86_0389 [Lacinutrix venerupis]